MSFLKVYYLEYISDSHIQIGAIGCPLKCDIKCEPGEFNGCDDPVAIENILYTKYLKAIEFVKGDKVIHDVVKWLDEQASDIKRTSLPYDSYDFIPLEIEHG